MSLAQPLNADRWNVVAHSDGTGTASAKPRIFGENRSKQILWDRYLGHLKLDVTCTPHGCRPDLDQFRRTSGFPRLYASANPLVAGSRVWLSSKS